MRFLQLSFLLLVACNRVYTPETSRTAVVFGDSIAFGTGTTHQRFNLASCLGKQTGAYFINMGVPGETTREATKRLPELLAQRPRLVVLSIGGNDLQNQLASLAGSSGKQGAFPSEETIDKLANIFAQLNREKIPVFYINMEPPLIYSNIRSVAAHADGRLGKVEALAAQFPMVHFVKGAMDGLWQNPRKMSDDIHPNNLGYADMCAKIIEQIRSHNRQ